MPLWLITFHDDVLKGVTNDRGYMTAVVESSLTDPVEVARVHVQEKIERPATVRVRRIHEEFVDVSVTSEVLWRAGAVPPPAPEQFQRVARQIPKFGNPFNNNESGDEFLGMVAVGNFFYDVWVARIEPNAPFGVYFYSGSNRGGVQGVGSVKDFMQATESPSDSLPEYSPALFVACMRARPLVENWLKLKEHGGR